MRMINRIRSRLGLLPIFRVYVSADSSSALFKIPAASLDDAIEEAKRRFIDGIEDAWPEEELETRGDA